MAIWLWLTSKLKSVHGALHKTLDFLCAKAHLGGGGGGGGGKGAIPFLPELRQAKTYNH